MSRKSRISFIDIYINSYSYSWLKS